MSVRRAALAAVAIACCVAAAVAVAAARHAGGRGDVQAASPSSTAAAPASAARSSTAEPRRRWRPPRRPGDATALLVRLERPLVAGGMRVNPLTPLGSRSWLLVVSRRGPHARVLLPFAGGRTAALDLRGLDLRWTSLRIAVDTRRLRLTIFRGRRAAGSYRIAAGQPSSPTPSGRFSVTDRVHFPPGGPYGTFALGISARQLHLPAGWTGGDQVAIHGTDDPGSLGRRVSLGCIRVPDAAIRLLRAVPLGAPVVVHA